MQSAQSFKRMSATAALLSKPVLTTLDTVLIRIRGTGSLALTTAYFVEGVRLRRSRRRPLPDSPSWLDSSSTSRAAS